MKWFITQQPAHGHRTSSTSTRTAAPLVLPSAEVITTSYPVTSPTLSSRQCHTVVQVDLRRHETSVSREQIRPTLAVTRRRRHSSPMHCRQRATHDEVEVETTVRYSICSVPPASSSHH